MLLNEVAPAAPIIIDALPALTILAVLLVVVGLIYAVHGFVKALFGAIGSFVGHIPLIGGAFDDAVRKAEHAISAALGSAEHSLDHHIALQLHRLARLAEKLWHELEQAAQLIFALSVLAGDAITAPILHRLLRPLHRAIGAVRHLVHELRVDVGRFDKAIEKRLPARLSRRLHALEHAVEDTLPRELKTTRELAKEAEAEATKAWDLVKSQPWVVTATAFAGAVALALDRLGLTWIRCNNTGRVGRLLCGGIGNLLGDLLEGIIDVLVVADLCRITELMIEAAESAPVQDGLQLFVDGLDHLLLCQGVSRPHDWQVHKAALPPLQPYSALPGVT